MRVLTTGGHLPPLLAVLEVLPRSAQILLVGRKHVFEGDSSLSLEYKVARELKIPFQAITPGRLQRTFTRYTFGSLLKLPVGFFQALTIVKNFKPDIVLSFGCYVSLPVVLSAALLRIPVVIHEQTPKAGLANRISSVFANKVCISWPTSKKYFPAEKTILTGSPVRRFRVPFGPSSGRVQSSKFKVSGGKEPLIYITGGSAGSHVINIAVEECIRKLLKKFSVIHQTGDSLEYKDFDRLEKIKNSLDEELRKKYLLMKLVDPYDVGEVIKACDLVVSRAGINTVIELMSFGKPALLIPLNSEQFNNAVLMTKIGTGEILPPENLSGKNLLSSIQSMMDKIDSFRKNQGKARRLINKNAAGNIKKVIYGEMARAKKDKETAL